MITTTTMMMMMMTMIHTIYKITSKQRFMYEWEVLDARGIGVRSNGRRVENYVHALLNGWEAWNAQLNSVIIVSFIHDIKLFIMELNIVNGQYCLVIFSFSPMIIEASFLRRRVWRRSHSATNCFIFGASLINRRGRSCSLSSLSLSLSIYFSLVLPCGKPRKLMMRQWKR
jgi:hypothetical protein